MRPRHGRVAGALAILVLAAAAGATPHALTASNVVPATRADNDVRAIGANDLKPSSCSALTLTSKVTGSGVINGTSASDLIAGSSSLDTITGGNGGDCLIGGAGDDALDGSNGSDVCLGGPGTDTFLRCETTVQ